MSLGPRNPRAILFLRSCPPPSLFPLSLLLLPLSSLSLPRLLACSTLPLSNRAEESPDDRLIVGVSAARLTDDARRVVLLCQRLQFFRVRVCEGRLRLGVCGGGIEGREEACEARSGARVWWDGKVGGYCSRQRGRARRH